MSDTDDFLPDLDLQGIKNILPHRYPFLMIDKVVKVTK